MPESKNENDENFPTSKTSNTNEGLSSNTLEESVKHEDLKLLLTWKGRTIHDWTKDDIRLGHLIRKRHYRPDEALTDEEKELIGRLVLERSQTEDKIHHLSESLLRMPKNQTGDEQKKTETSS